jgi:hypothetical protein
MEPTRVTRSESPAGAAPGGRLLGELDHEALALGLVTTAGTVSHTGTAVGPQTSRINWFWRRNSSLSAAPTTAYSLPFGRVPGDWTDGCIALSNAEIEELWRIVPDGTTIEIRP